MHMTAGPSSQVPAQDRKDSLGENLENYERLNTAYSVRIRQR